MASQTRLNTTKSLRKVKSRTQPVEPGEPASHASTHSHDDVGQEVDDADVPSTVSKRAKVR